jgi:hypothetical protein
MASIKIMKPNPTYAEWCQENGLDPNDEDNHDAYCEWKANNR